MARRSLAAPMPRGLLALGLPRVGRRHRRRSLVGRRIRLRDLRRLGGLPSSGGGYGGLGSLGVTISVSCTGRRARRILSSAPASRSASSSSIRFPSCSSSTSRCRASLLRSLVSPPDRVAERLERGPRSTEIASSRDRVRQRLSARVEPRPPHLGGRRGVRAAVGRQARGVLHPGVGAAPGRLPERREQDDRQERAGRCPTPSFPWRRGRSAAPNAAKPRQRRTKRAGIPSQRCSTLSCTTGPGTVSSGGSSPAGAPQLEQKRAPGASSSPQLRHALSWIGDALMAGLFPALQSP